MCVFRTDDRIIQSRRSAELNVQTLGRHHHHDHLAVECTTRTHGESLFRDARRRGGLGIPPPVKHRANL